MHWLRLWMLKIQNLSSFSEKCCLLNSIQRFRKEVSGLDRFSESPNSKAEKFAILKKYNSTIRKKDLRCYEDIFFIQIYMGSSGPIMEKKQINKN